MRKAKHNQSIETGSGDLETNHTQTQNIQFGFNPKYTLHKELNKQGQQHMSQTQLYTDLSLDNLDKHNTGYAKSNQNSNLRNKSSQKNLGSEYTLVSKRSRSTIKPPLDHNVDKSFYQFGSMGPSQLLMASGSKKSLPRMGDYH